MKIAESVLQKTSKSDEAQFYHRLDDKTIGNEFYVLQREIQNMYKSLSKGNDFKMQDWNQIKTLISKIDKAVEKVPSPSK